MTLIRLTAVSKSFASDGGSHCVFSGINLEIGRGEAVSLVGPNGIGKSTLAGIVAGIDPGYGGEIWRSPEIGPQSPVLFQDYRASLLPWLSISDNITYPLAVRGMPRDARDEIRDALLARAPARLDLKTATHRLSGGQAQLVCILRTLSVSPKLIVCDEPFSAIDYQARILLREELSRICCERGIAMLFISHSMEDAVLVADRVIVLTGQPATITADIAIDAPRPRQAAWLDGEAAIQARRRLREAITPRL